MIVGGSSSQYGYAISFAVVGASSSYGFAITLASTA
jgi:hypothetical protein